MADSQKRTDDWLGKLSDTQFRIVLAVIGLAIFALLFPLRSCGQDELPKPPPRPKEKASLAEAEKSVRKFEAQESVYIASLERDSKILGVSPATDIDTIKKAFPYRSDRALKLLRPGKESVEMAGLRLSVSVQKIRDGRDKYMVLKIENPGDTALAYRIETRPSKGTKPCKRKLDLPHNAMSVAAKSSVSRTECIYRKGWGVEVRLVETIGLPPLAHHYVSGLPARAIIRDDRVTQGHKPTAQRQSCRVFLGTKVEKALESGQTTWRDLIDFYGRHPCDTFEFPVGYTAWDKDAESSLPVTAP